MVDSKYFKELDKIEKIIYSYATEESVRIEKVECLAPLLDSAKKVTIWIFYEKNEDVENYKFDGTSDKIRDIILNYRNKSDIINNYDVVLTFDSKENVDENYAGSYFYRLR